MPKLILTLYTLAMLATSLVPMDSSSSSSSFVSSLNPSLQNFLHIPMFTGFVLLLFVLGRQKDRSLACMFGLIVLAMGYGAVLELIQIAVPGRFASLTDMTLNWVGLGIGVFCWLLISKRRLKTGDIGGHE